MFLLERAKALHTSGGAPMHLNGGSGGPPNPFGAPNNPFLGHPGFPGIRSGLFPGFEDRQRLQQSSLMMAGPLPTSPLGSMEMGGKDMLQRWRQSLPSMPLPPTIQVDPTIVIFIITTIFTIFRNLPHQHFHHNYNIHDTQESPSSSFSS